MSDFIPEPPRRPDPYSSQRRYEYLEDMGGRSNYAFVALLAIVALVGGVLFFARPQPVPQQAQTPVTAPVTAPAQE